MDDTPKYRVSTFEPHAIIKYKDVRVALIMTTQPNVPNTFWWFNEEYVKKMRLGKATPPQWWWIYEYFNSIDEAIDRAKAELEDVEVIWRADDNLS